MITDDESPEERLMTEAGKMGEACAASRPPEPPTSGASEPRPLCHAPCDDGEDGAREADFCDIYEASEGPRCKGRCALAPIPPELPSGGSTFDEAAFWREQYFAVLRKLAVRGYTSLRWKALTMRYRERVSHYAQECQAVWDECDKFIDHLHDERDRCIEALRMEIVCKNDCGHLACRYAREVFARISRLPAAGQTLGDPCETKGGG